MTKTVSAKTVVKKPPTSGKQAPQATIPPRLGGLGTRPNAMAKQRGPKSAKPAGTITAAAQDNVGEILLFGTIGADWFGEGITAESFNEALQQIGAVDKITLRVNSGGGDVFEATAIYNMLIKHGAEVTIEIEGVAASAATLISMAGDQIHISENAHFMIHAASGMAWGNAEELRQYLKLLDNADELIRLTYAARTNIDDAELRRMMAFDNWMTAKEALDHGFVDVIDQAKTVKPHVSPAEAKNFYQHGPTLSPDRIAAASQHLLALSAAVRPTGVSVPPTGDSPPPVSQSQPKDSSMKLTAKMRAKCVAAGMASNLSDADAEAWFVANEDKVLTAEAPKADPPKSDSPIGPSIDQILDAVDAREKRRIEARKAWRKEVDANIALAFGDSAPKGLNEACYDLQDDGIDAVRTKIQDTRKEADKNGPRIGISLAPSQPRDRHVAALRTGLLVRSLRNFTSPSPRLKKLDDGRWDWHTPSISELVDKHIPEKDRPEGWQDFSNMPLVKLAEECLLADGYTHDAVRRLAGPQVAMAAMGFARQAGIRAEGAIHTTGTLSEITRDAINKSLLAGYEEAPQTWRMVGRQGASVPDFKDIRRVKLSAAGNPQAWIDGLPPEKAKLSNEAEKYAVEAKAETLSFSWRLVINDDLNALSRYPQILGDAFARGVNAEFWQQITGNYVMADGVSLFSAATGNRKQDNLITGSATPTNSTIGSMRKLMRLMRGLNTPEGAQSEDILNLTPSVIFGPAALEELILKQVRSTADPASGGNSGVFNTAGSLTPVIEPLLDASSPTAFYLAASTNRIDTVELTFLQGFETPFAHEWVDNESMCQNYSFIQAFKAKAIEWRSLIKHAGA